MKLYLRYAAAYALSAFAVSLLLPIWSAYYFASWEVTGKVTWFPIMLDSLFNAAKQESRQTLIDYYGSQLVILMVVLLAGTLFGYYRARQAAESVLLNEDIPITGTRLDSPHAG